MPFVEVYLQNWDTHERAVVEAAKGLMTQVDRAMAALVRDLKDRGLFDSTLVVWMGEFGRTPQVNRDGGRDHFSPPGRRCWPGAGSAAGRGRQRPSGNGAAVVDRPVSVRDLMATISPPSGSTKTKPSRPPAAGR